MYSHNRKEKQELLEYLLGNKEHDAIGSGLTQEALLLWGDKDRVFPLTFGQQLQRYLKIFIFPNAWLLSFCSPVFHFSRFQNDIILYADIWARKLDWKY
nr:2-hydroxy-6-oxononadienedioate/2-hydroxy-6-oxononatrienedioate hydrolase-like [Ipomoea batatas]